ncbi:hypothetical protein M2319_000448 [Rhodobium gokarnense]|uniref:Transposase n=1 Tax=Rhodobium gokarnense TaxID=364296 RepID=A0ABT3H6W0_9HYPH|nr:hypothetical protein [Rhodobium gokarnense]
MEVMFAAIAERFGTGRPNGINDRTSRVQTCGLHKRAPPGIAASGKAHGKSTWICFAKLNYNQ